MKRVAGIYKITSPSGKVYIGQSWEINERFGNYRRRECTKQRALLFSFQKYGVDAHRFEVVHVLPFNSEQSEMDRLEQFYMDACRSQGALLLNCREAGAHGRLSEETKRRVSDGLRGNVPWNKGKRGFFTHSEETKARMGARLKHKKPNNYGKPRSPSAIEATRQGNLGRKRTPDQLVRIRAAAALRPPTFGGRRNKGRKHTPEHRAKLRASLERSGAQKGELHPHAKLTNALVLEIRSKFIPRKYSSRRLAAEYGMAKTTILDIVNRRIWTRI